MNNKNDCRICLISYAYNGGFKTFVDNIVRNLKKNGVEADLFFLNDNTKTDDTNKSGQIQINLLLKRKYPKKHFLSIRIIKKLKRNDNNLENHLYDLQLSAALKVLKIKGAIDLSKYDFVISTEEILCNYFYVVY